MYIVYADRVKETTTTTGTGAITLAGAVSGFRTFGSQVNAGQMTPYTIYGTSEWECGIGTYNTTLARTTVIASSNANALVNFSAGTKTVIADIGANFLSTYLHATDPRAFAGGTLSATDVVYFSTDGLGYVYKADTDLPYTGYVTPCVGFSVGAASLNEYALVRTTGTLGGFSGRTAGRLQFLSSTAGGVTETPPNEMGVLVGVAINSTTVLVNSQGNKAESRYPIGEKGYVAGGDSTGGVPVATTQKTMMTTDTTALQASANLSSARGNLAATSDGSTRGFFWSGSNGGAIGTTDRVTFFNDTTAAVASAAPVVARGDPIPVSDSFTKGYFCGGVSGAVQSSIEKLVYNTETTSSMSAALNNIRTQSAGLSDGSGKGFVGGGFSSGNMSSIERLVFAIDVVSAHNAVLSSTRAYLAACSEGPTKGFFGGGNSTAGSTTVDKLQFAVETVAAQASAALSVGRYGLNAFADGIKAGYWLGGQTGSNTAGTTTNKTAFVNDVNSTPGTAALQAAVFTASGVSNIGL